MNGYLYLSRRLTSHEYYSDAKVMRLFLHILMIAAWKDHAEKGVFLKRGQFIASREDLAEATGLTVKEVRTAIGKLKRADLKADQRPGSKPLYTVVSYDYYCPEGPALRPAKGQPNREEGKEIIRNNIYARARARDHGFDQRTDDLDSRIPDWLMSILEE